MTKINAGESAATVRRTADPFCPDHGMPLLDERKTEAFVVLLDWPGTTIVAHACEARLEIRKSYAD